MSKQVETYQTLSDNDLVRKIVETNDTHLFAVLYDRYADLVYNKSLSFAKSKEEAQDITHDIFVKLFVKLKTYKEKSKFSTWLYSFTYNFCVNYVQRKLNKKNEKFVLTDDFETKSYQEIPDQEIFQLKSDKLIVALEKLDPKDKVILLMKYQDDFSVKEIKQTLDIGESAVKMRINRAKSRLIEIYNSIG